MSFISVTNASDSICSASTSTTIRVARCRMIDELGVNFPVLFDARKEVSELYEVEAMPVTVLVDREGNVRYVHHGYKPGYEDKYLDQIRSLLRE